MFLYYCIQKDKHILCVTLLLGMTGDDDHNVRAAAIRALGVYVRFPKLREVRCNNCKRSH